MNTTVKELIEMLSKYDGDMPVELCIGIERDIHGSRVCTYAQPYYGYESEICVSTNYNNGVDVVRISNDNYSAYYYDD
jgi:hypothetical protein